VFDYIERFYNPRRRHSTLGYLSPVSIFSAVVSIFTTWSSLFRRGKIRLTKPAFIAFCYDVVDGGRQHPKILIRALLYSTGRRGQVIENLYLLVRRGESLQNFNIWGLNDGKMSRGSGLFVGETGVVADHHFNPPWEVEEFQFLPGNYELSVFAEVAGRSKPVHLSSITITAPSLDSRSLKQVWFEWSPTSGLYTACSFEREGEKSPGRLPETLRT
jgi:hypothetical protein